VVPELAAATQQHQPGVTCFGTLLQPFEGITRREDIIHVLPFEEKHLKHPKALVSNERTR
jgi:hypothetical protein